MLNLKKILPDYTTPINHFGLICFISVVVSFGATFIHDYVSLALGPFGYYLIILRGYRRDKRIGVNPLSISFRKRKEYDKYSSEFNKQEVQIATIGGILMMVSLVSYGVAPFMGEIIEKVIIVPLFG